MMTKQFFGQQTVSDVGRASTKMSMLSRSLTAKNQSQPDLSRWCRTQTRSNFSMALPFGSEVREDRRAPFITSTFFLVWWLGPSHDQPENSYEAKTFEGVHQSTTLSFRLQSKKSYKKSVFFSVSLRLLIINQVFCLNVCRVIRKEFLTV